MASIEGTVKIINLTPHEVTLMRSPNECQTFPSQGIARLVEERITAEPLEHEMAIGCPFRPAISAMAELKTCQSHRKMYYILSLPSLGLSPLRWGGMTASLPIVGKPFVRMVLLWVSLDL